MSATTRATGIVLSSATAGFLLAIMAYAIGKMFNRDPVAWSKNLTTKLLNGTKEVTESV